MILCWQSDRAPLKAAAFCRITLAVFSESARRAHTSLRPKFKIWPGPSLRGECGKRGGLERENGVIGADRDSGCGTRYIEAKDAHIT